MTINFRAVYLGAAVDLGSSSFFGSILTLGWSYALLVRGIPLEQLYPTIIASPAFLLASSIVGFAFSFLGGYVAASTAKKIIWHTVRRQRYLVFLPVSLKLLVLLAASFQAGFFGVASLGPYSLLSLAVVMLNALPPNKALTLLPSVIGPFAGKLARAG